MPNSGPTDIFSGGFPGSPNDWNDQTQWSLNSSPGANDIADNQGAGIIGGGESFTVLGLELDNSAYSLAIDGTLDITGGSSGPNTFTSFATNGATVDVNSGGSLILDSGITSATGTISMEGGAFTEVGAGSPTVDMSGGGTFNLDAQVGGFGNGSFGGVVENMNSGGTFNLILPGGATASSAQVLSSTQIQFNFGGIESYTVTFDSTANLSVAENGTEFVVTTVCFAAGSRILTTRGEIAVENLAIGDLAVTASGEARPITWIGRKTLTCPEPAAWPVRVMAGAFGEGLPARDLFLSPGHAVCVEVMDAVFVPVSQLINGATITQVEVADVTYWHVELESHDVLLAENMPCESYMDAGNRAFFGREYGRLAEVDPARAARSLAGYALPFVDKGPVVAAIRQRLDARAEALRSAQTDLRLKVVG